MIKNLTFIALLPIATLTTVALAQELDDDFDPAAQTVPVAEEDADASTIDDDAIVVEEDIAVEEIQSDEERLFAEFARYRQLLDAQTLDAADVSAKRIVELSIKVYGPLSRETANSLNNLGIVQQANEQYDAAIQNFTSAVEIIENVEDRLNEALVNPLKGLGAAQLNSGRPDKAYDTFTRAAHITQVNEGPHNLGQVEILESIAETFIRLGDTKSARNMLDRIHIINVKHFEANPMGLLPSLMSRAEWQHRAGYFTDERATYRRAIRIIESSTDSKTDPMLIEPLRRLGETFYYFDLTVPVSEQGITTTGESYFKRAVRVAGKAKGLHWRERSVTTLALADYYVFSDSQSRASKLYRQIWDELSAGDEEMLQQRGEWFDEPTALRESRLPQFAGNPPSRGVSAEDIATGKILVDYTVSTRGRVRKLKTAVNPEEFSDIQRVVHREIRSRTFRPKIVDGKAVTSEDIRFEHEFTYLKGDLEQLRAQSAEDEDEDEDSKNGED